MDFKQIMPPGARGRFDASLYTNGDWYAEEKLDGDRRILQILPGLNGYPRVRVTGRRLSDVNGLLVEKTDCVPHLNGEFGTDKEGRNCRAPMDLCGTVLDGEMIVDKPGARSRDVTSILGSKPELAIKKQQERGWLVYVAFDCLFFKGQDLRDMPLVRRRRFLRQAIEEWNNPYVRIVPNSTLLGVKPEQMVLDIWARKHPGEGIILKDLNSTYPKNGEDTKSWVKVKREFTEDVVIVGYDDPVKETPKIETYRDDDGIKRKRVLEISTSRLAENGWIGAIRFGQYRRYESMREVLQDPDCTGNLLVPHSRAVQGVFEKDGGYYALTYCGSCSGMDDETRKALSENKTNFIGTVVEILVNEREPSGKFRHPRMVQFRDNKNAEDCIWGQK